MRIALAGTLFAAADCRRLARPRRRYRRRQGEGRDCASAVTATTAFRKWRTFPRSRRSLIQFIQWQLVFFRAGTRKNEQMQPIVEQLNNEDIRNLGAYFASARAAEGAAGRQSGSVEEGRAGGGRAGAAPHATPTATPAPRRWPASPASARTISLKALHDYKIRRALRRRPWRRWPMSPIP